MKKPIPPVKPRAIVLDSAALIAGTDNLFALGGLTDVETGKHVQPISPDQCVTFYMTPDVVQEVRDPRARVRLAMLQGAVVLRAPSTEALAAVVAAAKLTGDFSVLSRTDLRVLALCYMLENEKNGSKFLKQPKPAIYSELRVASGVPFEQLDREENEKMEAQDSLPDAHLDDGWTTVETVKRAPLPPKKKRSRNKKKKNKNKVTESVVDTENLVELDDVHDVALETLDLKQADTPIIQPVSHPDIADEDVDDASDNPDDHGWINEDNLEEHLAKDGGEQQMTEEDEGRVGCVTTDFAMQNTMLQMGLKLLSVDGRRAIREIKHFALRCHTCGHISTQLERKFCAKCGNATMHRVAFRVNKKGIARVFMNPKKKAVLRGSKYPIPMPRGGRYNKDLILCEDQIDPVKQRRLEKQRARLNVDVLDPSNFYNAGARFNPHDRPIVVGYGRRNPNQVRPTSRKKGK